MSATDAFQLLSLAIQQPQNSQLQADALRKLRESLEVQQNRIPLIVSTMIGGVGRGGAQRENTLLKSWVLELMSFALGRSTLNWETKLQGTYFYHDCLF